MQQVLAVSVGLPGQLVILGLVGLLEFRVIKGLLAQLDLGENQVVLAPGAHLDQQELQVCNNIFIQLNIHDIR